MKFPVFSSDGTVSELGDPDNKPLSSVSFPQDDAPALVTIHDGTSELHAAEMYRLRLELTNPALLAAFDARDRKARQLSEWEARASQLGAIVFAKETRMAQRRTAGDSETAEELRQELAALAVELAEVREETSAALEELEQAQAQVEALTKVTA